MYMCVCCNGFAEIHFVSIFKCKPVQSHRRLPLSIHITAHLLSAGVLKYCEANVQLMHVMKRLHVKMFQFVCLCMQNYTVLPVNQGIINLYDCTLMSWFLGMLYIPDLNCPHLLGTEFSNNNITISEQMVTCCTLLYDRCVWTCFVFPSLENLIQIPLKLTILDISFFKN